MTGQPSGSPWVANAGGSPLSGGGSPGLVFFFDVAAESAGEALALADGCAWAADSAGFASSAGKGSRGVACTIVRLRAWPLRCLSSLGMVRRVPRILL